MLLSALVLLTSLGTGTRVHAAGATVDRKALAAAAGDTAQWLTHDRTYDAQRYSPLEQINTGNVKDLGLAWYADLDTARGQEGTPLVIDGVVYITTAWSKVKAYAAASGKLLWEYDPKVPGDCRHSFLLRCRQPRPGRLGPSAVPGNAGWPSRGARA